MFTKVMLIAAFLAGVASQDTVSVRVIGVASSEQVVNVNEAVATAVAEIKSACKKGENLSAVASAQARKVVQAAATAIAAGGIVIESTGNGRGAGSVSAQAKSTATAIAKAIATAIATIASGPEVSAATQAITQATESASAAIEQAAIVEGTGNAIAAAAASSTVFVAAVAEALAAAAGECDPATGEGTVAAQVQSTAQQLPTFADFTSTQAVSAGNIFGDGIAAVLTNSAIAETDGEATPSTITPPANQITPANDIIASIFCQLGVVTTGC